LTIKSEESHFKGECEFSVKDSDVAKMTMNKMLSKLNHKWPKFKGEGGQVILPSGRRNFFGKDRLSDANIKSDPTKTVSYQLVLEVDIGASPRTPTATSATVAQYAAKVEKQAIVQTATQESGFIAEDELGIEIRIFCDSGYHNVGVVGKAKEFSHRVELSYPDRDWNNLTWGQLKDRLSKFPGTYDGGEVLSQDGKKKFTNRDTLVSQGIKGDRNNIKTYQVLLRLDGSPPHSSSSSASAPASAPASTPAVSYSSASASSTTSAPKSTTTSHVRHTSANTPQQPPPSTDAINVELRLFVNNGMYECQVHASGAHKANFDFSLSPEKFAKFTMANLRQKFGAKWPDLKPGGVLNSNTGKITFEDSQTLKSLGIDANEKSGTKTFDLIFTVDT